jgi:hypothetical protein
MVPHPDPIATRDIPLFEIERRPQSKYRSGPGFIAWIGGVFLGVVLLASMSLLFAEVDRFPFFFRSSCLILSPEPKSKSLADRLEEWVPFGIALGGFIGLIAIVHTLGWAARRDAWRARLAHLPEECPTLTQQSGRSEEPVVGPP